MYFSGEYQHGMDEKSRLILPADYRESLGNKCKISKGHEACLQVYPLEAWEKQAEKLVALDDFSRANRDLKRRFFANSRSCEIDKQGRTLINQVFRSHAHIAKEVYIIGSGDHLQIWDRDRWEEYRVRLEGDDGDDDPGEGALR